MADPYPIYDDEVITVLGRVALVGSWSRLSRGETMCRCQPVRALQSRLPPFPRLAALCCTAVHVTLSTDDCQSRALNASHFGLERLDKRR